MGSYERTIPDAMYQLNKFISVNFFLLVIEAIVIEHFHAQLNYYVRISMLSVEKNDWFAFEEFVANYHRTAWVI